MIQILNYTRTRLYFGNGRLKFSIKSFYQTNSDQAYELYKITRDFAGLTEKNCYDLYTGTSTIAQFVSKKQKK
jgi:23S rRNA (uracil1939-C5)-methyltransferase